jgi:hypothetical protein
MADSRLVAELDKKLMEEGVIDPSYMSEYKKVHEMLNTHVRRTGKILTEAMFEKGDKKLRSWLLTLFKKGLSQDKLSSYLRCGLAHLCFDFIESNYQSIPDDDLITRAIQSFKMRNYNNSYFKIPAIKKAAGTAKKTAKKKAGKKPAKKSLKKKAVRKTVKKAAKKAAKSVKKAVKKIAKKSLKKTGKKASVKKKSRKQIKKKAGTKKTVKKSSPKKKVIKKKAVQKKAVKKAPARKKGVKKTRPRKKKSIKGFFSKILGGE